MAQPSKRVVIYARCSTSRDQKPEVQLEELKRFCMARDWAVAHEVVDAGWSGTTDRRPGFQKRMSLVRTREVDLVVVVKLDRLFRSLKHLVVTLQEFQELSVEFVSVKDQLDLATSSGRLMLHILAAFGEFEAALIRERTLLGLNHARSCGKQFGRPRLHDPKVILELRQQGLSYRKISALLNCSPLAITRAIQGASKSPAESSSSEEGKTSG